MTSETPTKNWRQALCEVCLPLLRHALERAVEDMTEGQRLVPGMRAILRDGYPLTRLKLTEQELRAVTKLQESSLQVMEKHWQLLARFMDDVRINRAPLIPFEELPEQEVLYFALNVRLRRAFGSHGDACRIWPYRRIWRACSLRVARRHTFDYYSSRSYNSLQRRV